MSSGIPVFHRSSSTQPDLARISYEEFQSFVALIRCHLENQDYSTLHVFFKANHTTYRPLLEQLSKLECLLEMLLEKPRNDRDCRRAYELAVLMENNGYSPRWAQIGRAMCYHQEGNERNTNTLVKEMVNADRSGDISRKSFIQMLQEHVIIYKSTGNASMLQRINDLLERYTEIINQPEVSITIPFGIAKA